MRLYASLLLLLLVFSEAAAESSFRFYHEAYSYAVPGRKIRIKAVVGLTSDQDGLRCSLRWDSRAGVIFVSMKKMEGTRFSFEAVLPPPPADSTKLAYTLQVVRNGAVIEESREFTTPIKKSLVPGWQKEFPPEASVEETPSEKKPETIQAAVAETAVIPPFQEPAPHAEHIPARQPAKIKFGGSIELFGTTYLTDKRNNDTRYGEARILPKVTVTPTDNILLYLQGDLRMDSTGTARGAAGQPVDRSGKQRIIEIREGYAEVSDQFYRFRIGKQIYDWSVTDTVTVADNLNPKDWNDLIRWERVGVPSLDTRIGTDSFVQAVYVPWFTPSRIPGQNDRWSQSSQPGVPALDQELPASGNGQVAVRAGTIVNGFDMGANAYYGYNFSPAGKLTPTSLTTATLAPYYRRMEVYGASMAKELYGYNLRLESGYFYQHGGDRFIQYIGGIDREWGNILKQSDSLYLLLQYADETVLTRGDPHLLQDFRRVFMKSVTGKMKYGLDDSKEWSIKLDGVLGAPSGDSYFEPSVVWRRSDLSIEAGFGFLGGAGNSFWGGYNGNNRLFFKGTYSF